MSAGTVERLGRCRLGGEGCLPHSIQSAGSAAVSVAARKASGLSTHPMGSVSRTPTSGSFPGSVGNSTARQVASTGHSPGRRTSQNTANPAMRRHADTSPPNAPRLFTSLPARTQGEGSFTHPHPEHREKGGVVPGVCAQMSAFELPDSHSLSVIRWQLFTNSRSHVHLVPEHREKGGVVPGACAQVSAFELSDSHLLSVIC